MSQMFVTNFKAIGRVRYLLAEGKLNIAGRKLKFDPRDNTPLSNLTAPERAVLLEMAANADTETKLTWCPQGRVSSITGLSLTSVKSAMKVLTSDDGPLQFDHWRSSAVKVYRVVLPKDSEEVSPAQVAEEKKEYTPYVHKFRQMGEVIPKEERIQ